MNRPIRVLAVVCGILFLALLLNVNYVQFVEAGDLNARQGNRRVIDEEFSRERGPILVAGTPIARSVSSDDDFDYQREYPTPQIYANLTGYYSYEFGGSDLESSQNGILSGSDPRLFVNRVVDLLGSNQPSGGSVQLTIDADAQKAAYEGLQGLGSNTRGSVVALDPDTGGILAMVSLPSYDPNRLASHDFEAVRRNRADLLDDESDPLLDRSRQNTYAPGSTFKLVTAAAALSSGDYSPDTMVPAGPTLDLPLTDDVLGNDVSNCDSVQQATLTFALQFSCNTSFGAIGLDLGADALREQAEAFGFGDDSYLDELALVPSQFPDDPDEPQTAFSAIGQFDVASTPLQMAMVTAGIGNGGTVMKPYIVDEIRSPDVELLEQHDPEELHQAVSSGVASQLTQMMVAVVDDGTASEATIPGIEVAGKTGTAERTEALPPYAWFVSFAPADDPEVAVAVFVESTEGVPREEISGGGLAGPIAKAVMEAVIQ